MYTSDSQRKKQRAAGFNYNNFAMFGVRLSCIYYYDMSAVAIRCYCECSYALCGCGMAVDLSGKGRPSTECVFANYYYYYKTSPSKKTLSN